jgi:hypothetical protein
VLALGLLFIVDGLGAKQARKVFGHYKVFDALSSNGQGVILYFFLSWITYAQV